MTAEQFSCVYCGERVDYVDGELVCSNPECDEKHPTAWNPLKGSVWVKDPEKDIWSSVSKEYVLAHIEEFVGDPDG